MTDNHPPTLFLILLLMQGVAMSGCTLIGAGIGAAADHHDRTRHDRTRHDINDIERVKMGVPLNVRMEDGRHISGENAGMRRRAEAEYAAAHRARRRHAMRAVPELGSEVVLKLTSGERLNGTYSGVGWDGADYYVSLAEQEGSEARTRVLMEMVDGIDDTQGSSYNARYLEQYLRQRTIPLLEGLALVTEAGVEVVPLEQAVAIVEPSRGKKAIEGGLMMGFVIDALVVTLVAITVSQNCCSM